MKEFRYNRVLMAIILISLVCGLWLVYSRHQVEVRNDTVEMAMDYQALRRIADWKDRAKAAFCLSLRMPALPLW
jgi:hypothetical protein